MNGCPVSFVDPFGLYGVTDIFKDIYAGIKVIPESTIPYLKSDEAKTAYKQTAVTVVAVNASVVGGTTPTATGAAVKTTQVLMRNVRGLTQSGKQVLQSGKYYITRYGYDILEKGTDVIAAFGNTPPATTLPGAITTLGIQTYNWIDSNYHNGPHNSKKHK